MEVGQPATSAPAPVMEAAKKALDTRPIGYTEALGIPELREAIAGHYQNMYDLDLPADRIVVTTGSSAGFLLSFLSMFNAGDRVALAEPGYPAYRNIMKAVDLNAVGISCGPDTNFQPSPELLASFRDQLDGLLVASPSNPTGTMLTPTALKDLVDYCKSEKIAFISDEIYHGLTYGQKAVSALSYSSDAVIINSFSKYFSMTGWRLGWMVVPETLLKPIEKLTQSLYISAPAISQYAAVEAFNCEDELEGFIGNYARNRDLLLTEFPKLGLDKLAAADGAFYIYADVSHLTDDSMKFCQEMLDVTGVAATPGIDFDPNLGHKFVRFSFAGSFEDMRGAVYALKSWL
nr:aminotransferase class I/II-fold pyridoxal phosphate-dependent enzyme [Sneathiella limimaris]